MDFTSKRILTIAITALLVLAAFGAIGATAVADNTNSSDATFDNDTIDKDLMEVGEDANHILLNLTEEDLDNIEDFGDLNATFDSMENISVQLSNSHFLSMNFSEYNASVVTENNTENVTTELKENVTVWVDDNNITDNVNVTVEDEEWKVSFEYNENIDDKNGTIAIQFGHLDDGEFVDDADGENITYAQITWDTSDVDEEDNNIESEIYNFHASFADNSLTEVNSSSFSVLSHDFADKLGDNTSATNVSITTAYEDATWYHEDDVSVINISKPFDMDNETIADELDEIELTIEKPQGDTITITAEWDEDKAEWIAEHHPQEAGEYNITEIDGTELNAENTTQFHVAPYVALSEYEALWNTEIDLEMDFYKADGEPLTKTVDWAIYGIDEDNNWSAIEDGSSATSASELFTVDAKDNESYIAANYIIAIGQDDYDLVGFNSLPVVVDLTSDAEEIYTFNPAAAESWSGTLLDGQGEGIGDYSIYLQHESNETIANDVTSQNGEWSDKFNLKDAANYNITIPMNETTAEEEEYNSIIGLSFAYSEILNVSQLSFNIETAEDWLEVEVSPTSAIAEIDKEMTIELNISNFDKIAEDRDVKDDANITYVLEGVEIYEESVNSYKVVNETKADKLNLGIYSELEDDVYTKLVLHNESDNPELEFTATFAETGTLDITAYVETEHTEGTWSITNNIADGKADLHGTTTFDVLEPQDAQIVEDNIYYEDNEALDEEWPIQVIPDNNIQVDEDNDRLNTSNGLYEAPNEYYYLFEVKDSDGESLEWEAENVTEIRIEGAGVDKVYEVDNEEKPEVDWDDDRLAAAFTPLYADDLTIEVDINTSNGVETLTETFEVKGLSADVELDGETVDSISWGDAEELFAHITLDDKNINDAILTVSQEWGDEEYELKFDETTDAGEYELELDEAFWKNITTGDLNISAYLEDDGGNVYLAYFETIEVEMEEAFEIEVEPSELTAGMEHDYINITVTEDGEPITDLVDNFEDYTITLDTKVDESQEIEEDEIEAIDADEGQYQIEKDMLFNESGTFEVAVEYQDQKGGIGTFDSVLPTISYEIEANGEFFDDLVATAAFDREYNVTVWAEDVNGEPIEGTIWLLNETKEDLNETFVENSIELDLNESGMAEFVFTPEDPVEVIWKVAGETVDKDDAAVVEEPKLLAEQPSIEMTEVFTGMTSEVVDDMVELDVVYDERNDIRFVVNPADDRDTQIDNKRVVIDGSIANTPVHGATSFSDEFEGQMVKLSVTPNALGDEIADVYIGDKDKSASDIIGDYDAVGLLNSFQFEDVTKELELEIITDEDDWVEGEDIEFRVTADDEAVEDATVWFNDEEATTDEDGYATLVFEEAGEYTVTAEKDDETIEKQHITYEDDSVEIEIAEDVAIPGFTAVIALLGMLGALAAVLIRNKQN
ncbi:DUF4198 domain-containing protein [Methanonatronarchaeum sp. AMET6-2]|uniref:DUF4198 domain-containing protein n=1 Tax=Methanonatronarchaeum sp. AMET6-2 TaxID=2933293 RepID=UPI001FF14309|nr:DUF4198 domain-containing protein [Methanonatronarchaeum sp. AMET6-2]UOY09622.1 DUF4198 domain-containing protein [Methanonatronarchaeum sp. AMET6-2]